ncbi:hypothetical protein GGF31_007938 [Allomyces arbusculus]|nr:hypothetical protein GGF31_007938 [Allomyces arbusculus]
MAGKRKSALPRNKIAPRAAGARPPRPTSATSASSASTSSPSPTSASPSTATAQDATPAPIQTATPRASEHRSRSPTPRTIKSPTRSRSPARARATVRVMSSSLTSLTAARSRSASPGLATRIAAAAAQTVRPATGSNSDMQAHEIEKWASATALHVPGVDDSTASTTTSAWAPASGNGAIAAIPGTWVASTDAMLSSMAPETSAPALVVDSAAQGGTTWAAVVASGSPIRAPTPARPAAAPVLDDTDLFPALLPTSSTDSLGLTSHDAEIDLRTSLTATTLTTSASGLATPIPQANTARPATPTPARSAGGKGVGPVLLGNTKAALMLDGGSAATHDDDEVVQTPVAPVPARAVTPVSQANPDMHDAAEPEPHTSSALGRHAPTPVPATDTDTTSEPFIALASRTVSSAIAAAVVVTPTPTPAPPGDHLADSYVWVASTPTSSTNSSGMTTTSPGSPATECWAIVPRPTRSGKSSPTAMGLSGEAVRRSMLLSPSPRATAKVPVGAGVGENGVLRHFAPPYVPVGARSPTRNGLVGEGDGGERRADRMLP